jgi:RNA polymerase sigma-70 factor (ECF subfamily)
LLQQDFLKKVDRQKGRFRSFLLASLTNFLNDEWRKEKAEMRGGAVQVVSIDEIEAEEKYKHLPRQEADSSEIFDYT